MPTSDRERLEADREQGQRIGADHACTAEPQRGHREDCDRGGLEHSTVFGRWPAAQAAALPTSQSPAHHWNSFKHVGLSSGDLLWQRKPSDEALEQRAVPGERQLAARLGI